MYNVKSLTLSESHNVVMMENQAKEKSKIEKMRKDKEYKEKSIKEFSSFINNCKVYFIVESMVNTIDNAMKNSNISYNRNICKNIIQNYVNEAGAENTLRRMEEETMYLSERADIIRKSLQCVEENCNKTDKSTFNIKTSTNTEFFDRLNFASNDQLTKTICKSIQTATQDYVEGVIKDKQNMEETANKVKERVSALKTNDKDIQESYYKLYERKINETRKERPKNLLESLIINISKNVLKSDNLKSRYVCEGKIDVDGVETIANSIYITLEAMNTTRFKTMDKDYFNSVLKSTK